jgi:fumarate reductase subunit C
MNDCVKPTATTLDVISFALLVWFSIALFFFIVAWAIGGPRFYDGLVGNFTFPVVVAGFVAGLVGHLASHRKT